MKNCDAALAVRCLIAAVFFPGLLRAGALEFEAPQIEIPATGQPAKSEIITLKLLNTGAMPLQIGEIKASCGCLKVNSVPSTIEAHSTANVEMLFKSRERAAGYFRVHVIATTKGDQAAVAETVVVGCILPPSGILVEPPIVEFGRVLPDDMQTRRRVRISCAGGVSAIRLIPNPNYFAEVDKEAAVETLKGVKVFAFTIRRTLKEAFDSEIAISKDGTQVATIPIRATEKKLESVVPNELFVDLRGNAPVVAKVLVESGSYLSSLDGWKMQKTGVVSTRYTEWQISVADAKKIAPGSHIEVPVISTADNVPVAKVLMSILR